jgi:hypothetical protein
MYNNSNQHFHLMYGNTLNHYPFILIYIILINLI